MCVCVGERERERDAILKDGASCQRSRKAAGVTGSWNTRWFGEGGLVWE